MSGFFGIVREDGALIDENLLREIGEEMRFRGPDGIHICADKGVGGCFALMRTGPAPQAERQPVELGGRYRLWGDFRLDAREELLQQLGSSAARANASSEELFLEAWRQWGEGALQTIIGDFSFALWDERERTLWCARDFIGSRPFYYAYVGRVFCFSNTLDILKRVPQVAGQLDDEYLGDFLLEGWNMEPSRTIYRDIRRLRPGHVLQFSNARVTIRRFRKLAVEEPLRFKRAEEYAENYLEVLRAAVKDRLPESAASLYLSGGLDSGAVCAIATQIAKERRQSESLKAFTISWKPLLADAEPEIASVTARHLGLKHEIFQEQEFSPFESANSAGATPEPILEPFVERERRQFRRIAAHANVVLSGDGGDDVQIGQAWPYLTYLWQQHQWDRLAYDFGAYFLMHGRMPPLRAGLRRKIRRLFRADSRFSDYPSWLNEDFEASTKLRERWLQLKNQKGTLPKEHPAHPRAYNALHDGYWAGIHETEDAGWTRVGLEMRAPFLDLRVLRYLFRLPVVPWCVNKELGRLAMKDLLPASVARRAKTPLSGDAVDAVPAEKWRACLPQEPPEELKRFVKWDKWCETFREPKGSLNWLDLRPLSLLKWFESH